MSPLHDTMTRTQKALFLTALDGLAMMLAILVALQLRLGDLWPNQYFAEGYGVFIILPLMGSALSWGMGIPLIVLRSFERNALLRLVQFAFIMAVIFYLLNWDYRFGLPRSIPGIWAAVFLAFAIFSRLAILGLLDLLIEGGGNRRDVLVYGAGRTGQQLVAALGGSTDMRAVAFLDDNRALRRVEVAGLRVYHPSRLAELTKRHQVKTVILAMPSVRPTDRREKLAKLSTAGLEVLTLPSFNDLLSGRQLTDQIRPVSPDELLGRAAVNLGSEEVQSAYSGRSIMVSGAGGSIGSELTRQIISANPSRLVLFDHSEYALYEIDREVRSLFPAGDGPHIVPVLGSVTDPARVADTLKTHSVQIVLHAAAYKHVPLVEHNAVQGAYNNVIGTKTLAEAALAAGVERFILVSTDKAVRPTNVMGATKRLAELVVQDMQSRSNSTIFTMVRFGNVLGSSGSVIPLFREQIEAGGPVTLTHEDVTRYFMTIPEAAQLVLLAGAFATGGDVFLLDMGEPVRISDLARNLIKLSGLTVRDAANPDGDIEIVTTGLRPGEKLFEELLIGDNVMPTPHPKILRAGEGQLSSLRMAEVMSQISAALAASDNDGVRQILWSVARPTDQPDKAAE